MKSTALFLVSCLFICSQAIGVEVLRFPGGYEIRGMSPDGSHFLQRGTGSWINGDPSRGREPTADIAFISARDGQMTQLIPLPEHNVVRENIYMSRSGSFVAGVSEEEIGMPFQPALWNSTGDSVSLSLPNNELGGLGWAVSDDGTIVAGIGWTRPADQCCKYYPHRWTNDGEVSTLTTLPGHGEGTANAVSHDGRVIVGTSLSDSPEFTSEATLWIEDNSGAFNPSGLGRFQGENTSGLFVSSDGTAIVGVVGGNENEAYNFIPRVRDSDKYEPFRWTEYTGIVPLGGLGGAAASLRLSIRMRRSYSETLSTALSFGMCITGCARWNPF